MPLIEEIIALEEQRMERNKGIRARGLNPGVRQSEPVGQNLLANSLFSNFRRQESRRKLESSLGVLTLEKERASIDDPQSSGVLAELLSQGTIGRGDASRSPNLIQSILPALLQQQTAKFGAQAGSNLQAAKGQNALDVQRLENQGGVSKEIAGMLALMSIDKDGKISPEILKLLGGITGSTGTISESGGKKEVEPRKLVDPKRDLLQEITALLK